MGSEREEIFFHNRSNWPSIWRNAQLKVRVS